jgi:protein-S-isoprenylcysteine O-methyltransferase Ste14
MITRLIFEALYYVLFILAGIIRKRFSVRYPQERKNPDRLDLLLSILPVFGMLVFPLIYTFTSWLEAFDYRLPATAGWTGVLIFVISDWLLYRSHVDLGSGWSVQLKLQEEHILVTHGVYRHIRHPMYLAHLVWGIAQPLLLWNWVAGFSMLVFTIPLLVYRLPREEEMMAAEFGSEYAEYQQHSGAIFPKLKI